MSEKFSQLDTGSVRANKDIELAVNRGLAASMLDGVAAGAAVMKAAGVPLHVSARVLAQANHRRNSDWQQNSVLSAEEPR